MQQLSTNTFGCAKWIVSSDPTQGTHTTISAAIASASSGDTIFLRTGTYTENITLKAGVSVSAYDCDALSQNVNIIGKVSFSSAGAVAISGVYFQTNGDFSIQVSGSAASILYLKNCKFNFTNNTGVSFSSSNASSLISFIDSLLNVGNTGITFITSTSVGSVEINNCLIGNSGMSTVASTVQSTLNIYVSSISIPVSVSSTGSISAYDSKFFTDNLNTTGITLSGTSSVNLSNSAIFSGSASCLSIGVGCTASVFNSRIDSSNTNAITGSGQLIYGSIAFSGNSSLINPSILTGHTVEAGGISFDGGINTLSTYVPATSWTPLLQFGGSSTGITYATQIGKYTRVGNVINIWISLVLTSKGAQAGTAVITGLPFTVNGSGPGADVVFFGANITAPASTTYLLASCGGTNVNLYGINGANGSITNLADTNFADNSILRFQFSYYI